jgi:hypothetical protein
MGILDDLLGKRVGAFLFTVLGQCVTAEFPKRTELGNCSRYQGI